MESSGDVGRSGAMSTHTMMRAHLGWIGAAGVVVFCLAAPGTAGAQELPPSEAGREVGFGTRGNLVLGVEDLVVAGAAWEAGAPEGWGGTSSSGEEVSGRAQETAWGVWNPVRFAADVFVLPHLSLGAAVRFEHARFTRTVTVDGSEGDTTSDGNSHHDTAKVTTLRFSPRVGYGRWFEGGMGAWVRAGVDLGSTSAVRATGTPGVDGATGRVFGVSVEALAVFQPLPHTLVAVGPTYRRTSIDGGSGDHLVALVANLGVEL